MIPSSYIYLLFFLMSPVILCAMDQPLPKSPSKMAFPAPKKDESKQGGSLIIRTIRRTASLLSVGDRPASGELEESTSAPGLSHSIAIEELQKNVQNSAPGKKEFIFGKPIYTIEIEKIDIKQKKKLISTTVSIEGDCMARYRVNSLAEFKKGDAYLQRVEILQFINQIVSAAGKDPMPLVSYRMGTKDKQQSAKKAARLLTKYKSLPDFNKPFYVVSLEKSQQYMCVFESDIKEK